MVFQTINVNLLNAYNVNNYTNSLYLRFEVKDKPGVLSKITNRLAKYKISVKRLIQTPDKKIIKLQLLLSLIKQMNLILRIVFQYLKKIKIFLNILR